ncbi:MAG: DUF484 family protein [Pseudomonadota bacterium]
MNEDDVRNYLSENPDFLRQNPDLLALMSLPHVTGDAVSLVERQVSVLRDRNVDLRHKLRDLGAAARTNEQLFNDVRALMLALIPKTTVSELEAAVLTALKGQFHLEYASLTLFTEAFSENELGDARSPASTHRLRLAESQCRARLAPIVGRRSAGCGPLREQDFEFLFPGSATVGSVALAYIEAGSRPLGMLAVGSSDSGHYESSTGTLFLEFAAEVVGLLLQRLRTS